jgi:hypothetical protein
MTPFSLSSRVSADEAKQDKIELNLGTWCLRRRLEGLRAYFRELGTQPVVVNNRHTYLPEKRRALEAWGRKLEDTIRPAADEVVTLERAQL